MMMQRRTCSSCASRMKGHRIIFCSEWPNVRLYSKVSADFVRSKRDSIINLEKIISGFPIIIRTCAINFSRCFYFLPHQREKFGRRLGTNRSKIIAKPPPATVDPHGSVPLCRLPSEGLLQTVFRINRL